MAHLIKKDNLSKNKEVAEMEFVMNCYLLQRKRDNTA